ncbi:MAG: U32 family peptidase, partial [Candidatus Hydrogenedentes bacterium]|nr:U32 family peptidase [Candidatus Hydrogenedentota bacterium]
MFAPRSTFATPLRYNGSNVTGGTALQPAEEIRTLQRRVELLAPAGRFDVLEAVLDAGADAVYLSGKRFQMRAHRSDFHFSDEALREAIARVHDLGRRVYVTVNTLLSAEETKEIPVYLSFLAEAAVDGIIVCDLATITLARELAVPFELHASTMMNAHDLDQVLMLKDLGCTRIVTSRDISLREAGRLGEQSGLEIEYFVHGDMCVAQSGQCSMSGLLFGKSANRGECMKPCRSAYQLVSLRGEHVSMPLKEGHLMALRDLSLLRQLPEVVEAGICSLKIEGRMRDAEYLAGLVALYRGALDRYYALPSAYQTDSAMLQALFKHRVRELSALSCTGASSTTNFFDISGKREPLILSDGCREPTISTAPVLAAPSNPSTESIQPTPALAVCVASVAATRAAIAAGAGRIYLAAETRQFGEEGWRRETLVEAMALVQDASVALGLRTPRVSTSRARAEWRALMDCCRGRNVAFVLAHHFGALKRARENLPGAAIIADYGFNVLNPTAAATLRRLGAHAVMPALEAGFDDVRALVESQAAPLELIVHGPIEGMLLEHCLIAALLTKHGSKDTCRGPCHHTEFALRDAKGETRLIITDQYCRNHLLTAND